MRLKKVLGTSLVLLHLLLVAAFIWVGLPARVPGKLGKALRTYNNLSGSFRDYTYFAPAVGDGYKAAFILEDEHGQAQVIDFLSANKEVDFRYQCLITVGMQHEELRDVFAQSWAALLLGSHPEARKVTVMAKRNHLPTMSQYRQGQRPIWVTVYAGEFVRREDERNKTVEPSASTPPGLP